MVWNPLNGLKDRLRFRALVREEIGFLIERHGGGAAEAAALELRAPDVSPRRAQILRAALQQLKR